VLLKLSGESFAGEAGFGLDPEEVDRIAEEVKQVHHLGVDIGVVVGGGNFFRARSSGKQVARTTADYMGMLASVLNSLALQEALESKGVVTRLQSAIEMREVAEPYIRRRAIRHLEKKRIVIFAAGTGNPYFTTDTAAALRAAEINAQIILKATTVDGIYEQDPKRHAGARKLARLSYLEALEREIAVIDGTAVSLCKETGIPIKVFDLRVPGNIRRIILGESIGSTIGNAEETEKGPAARRGEGRERRRPCRKTR
jgi:uridylate kinase